MDSATAQNITRDRPLHSIIISYLNPSSVIHDGPYTYNKCNTTCIMIEHSLWLLCNLHVSIGYIPPHYWHRYFTPLGCKCFKNLQWQIIQSKKHAILRASGISHRACGWTVPAILKDHLQGQAIQQKWHSPNETASYPWQVKCSATLLSEHQTLCRKYKIWLKKYTKFLSSYELHHCIIQTKTWLCCPFMLCGG